MKKLLLILLCLPMIGFGQGCTLDDIFIFDFSESRFQCKLKALDKKNYVKHNPDILEPWYFNEWFDYPYLPPNSVYKTSDFYFHILQLKEFNCMHNWNKIKHYTTNYASNRLHGYNNMRLVFANDKLYRQEFTLHFHDVNDAKESYDMFTEIFNKEFPIRENRVMETTNENGTKEESGVGMKYKTQEQKTYETRQKNKNEDWKQFYLSIFFLIEDGIGKVEIQYYNTHSTDLTNRGY